MCSLSKTLTPSSINNILVCDILNVCVSAILHANIIIKLSIPPPNGSVCLSLMITILISSISLVINIFLFMNLFKILLTEFSINCNLLLIIILGIPWLLLILTALIILSYKYLSYSLCLICVVILL